MTGKLPVSRVDVDETPAGDGLFYPRRYDVTLVSRENIYINGNLASGPNWLPPPAGLDPNPLRRPWATPWAPPDRCAARIALLAEKNVAVNATKGVYQGDGIATDCDRARGAGELGQRGLLAARARAVLDHVVRLRRRRPFPSSVDPQRWDVGWSVHRTIRCETHAPGCACRAASSPPSGS